MSKRKTITIKVSKLTKKWAFKGAEQAFRALAGNAVSEDTKIVIKHKKD